MIGFITVGIYDSYNQDEEKIRKIADFYYKNWDEVSNSKNIRIRWY